MFLSSSLLARATVAVLLLYPLTVLHAGAGHGPRADSHAPIGVMGDHLHGAGEFMISYRYMHMDMAGSRIGTRRVSPEFIVQNVPNRFAGRPGQPAAHRGWQHQCARAKVTLPLPDGGGVASAVAELPRWRWRR